MPRESGEFKLVPGYCLAHELLGQDLFLRRLLSESAQNCALDKCMAAVNPPACERRVLLEKRRRVAEMSPEEMRRELLTSEVTRLPNRRAFAEAGPALAVAMSDVDGLKALNDHYGYDIGNAILQAKADALLMAGLEAYHDKGDEFLCRGDDLKDLIVKLDHARSILRDRTIVVGQADGSALSVTGADFSYGVGHNLSEAEQELRNHKAKRKAEGQIVRGELRNISVMAELPNSVNSDPALLP
jgi:predicted signal transduction protein with EAL and GGDEF domain